MERPFSVFDIAGRAMSAQLVRLNANASNMANAGTVSGTREGAYRAMRPVFTTVEESPGVATVRVDRVVAAGIEPTRRHSPGHPLADADGYVWEAGVDHAAELIEMVETARQYQNNVQVLQTAKTLTLDTLKLGQ
jgi:flagellar basal-body rod protein FlgC